MEVQLNITTEKSENMNILIVEPHYDDAWINLGGFIFLHKEYRFHILTVSDYPTNNEDGLTVLQKHCANVTGDFLGYKSVGFDDAHMLYLQQQYGETDFLRLFMKMNEVTELATVKEKILRYGRDVDMVLWPLGLKHPQHIIMTQLNPFTRYALYREFPYFFYPDQKTVGRDMTMGLSCTHIGIESVHDQKMQIFRHAYPSQHIINELVAGGMTLYALRDEVFWNVGQ